MENILAGFGGQYRQGTFMGRYPNDPITVFGNSSNVEFFKELQKALSHYIDSFWRYPIEESMNNEELRIYINGEPSFNNNGQVKIE